MTAEAPAGLSADLAGLPAWTLDEGQLGDLELLLSGALPPLRGFMSAAEADSVTATGRLPDGTPWPVPVTFEVPASAIKPDASRLVLQDPEGTPLAVLAITDRAAGLPGPDPARRPGDRVRAGRAWPLPASAAASCRRGAPSSRAARSSPTSPARRCTVIRSASSGTPRAS